MSFVEEIVARTGQHVVVARDFDAMPDAASIRFWRGAQALDGTSVAYRDAWQLTHTDEPGPTFAPSMTPLVTESWHNDLDRRIDYILIRCTGGKGPSMRITGCARVLDSPVDNVWGSDHFGVTAEFWPATGNA